MSGVEASINKRRLSGSVVGGAAKVGARSARRLGPRGARLRKRAPEAAREWKGPCIDAERSGCRPARAASGSCDRDRNAAGEVGVRAVADDASEPGAARGSFA